MNRSPIAAQRPQPAKRPRRWPAHALALAVAGMLAACGGSDNDDDDNDPQDVGDTIALTTSGKLVSFDRATPGTRVGEVEIDDLADGVTLLGIDIRPADGLLYALASNGTLYTIDPATGESTLKATLKAAASDDAPFTALEGASFGVDFNPVADRLRVVSNTGQNLRINVDTGDVITDGAITPTTGTAAVTAAAYTNSFAGTTSTQLFDLDLASGLLHLQDPPNAGGLSAGVALGLTATAANGFDIDARSNTGYAVLDIGGTPTLVTVNLAATTAAATAVGAIDSDDPIVGLALVQAEAPTALGLTADNTLVAFDPQSPNTLTSTQTLTGLASGETVVGIDFRPADGLLYALTDGGALYTIDPATGAATAKARLAAAGDDATAPFTALDGTRFSVDFNPVADRLRVISETGQNLRINVDTGATTTDGLINRAVAPSVAAAAYTNSFAGTTSTTLFNLEANGDVLTQQVPPNDGTLADVGALGVDITGGAAFDIAGGGNGLALMALATGSGPSTLYTVSLATGAATRLGTAAGTDAALAVVGGASGKGLIDLALRP